MNTSCERRVRDLEYDNDRLRDKLEHDERRRQREEREAAERREEQRRAADPSNRLYNGEVSNFREAISLTVQCLEREITEPSPDDDQRMRKMIQDCNKSIRERIAEANRATDIYRETVEEAEKRAVEKMRAAGLADWANCLESGDYSNMAV